VRCGRAAGRRPGQNCGAAWAELSRRGGDLVAHWRKQVCSCAAREERDGLGRSELAGAARRVRRAVAVSF
jgi:hypothetical protein